MTRRNSDIIIGYTQGTYDMFHIGHLNLLQNAKRLCDILVVGVNSDELVKEYKQKSAIIPLEERMAIIQALRCVDKVIACETLDKKVAFENIHFKRLFIGDDWKGNERWAATELEMKSLGVEVVFLPYTKNTSSTLLREKLSGY